MQSGAVVALKPLRSAKSRLQAVPVPYRQHIAWCLAYDTISALASSFDQVVVVSNEPSLSARLSSLAPTVRVRSEGPSLGMNAALTAGAAELLRHGASLVAACVGDLPCLRPETVGRLVAAAGRHSRCFVPDAAGTGTTMLFARGVSLDPRFQGPSAAAHRGSGAVPLTEEEVGPLADARRDVDTLDDLVDAERIGLGPRTAALFDENSHRLGRFEAITIAEPNEDGGRIVIADDGTRLPMPPAAEPAEEATPGRRLHAALAPDRVLTAWQ
jgi:2-phospho-L-lactate/phosphoenolpyruvate guanylyltransferase